MDLCERRKGPEWTRVFLPSHQVEDLGRAINQIGVNLERIKHNHGVILAAVKNQG